MNHRKQKLILEKESQLFIKGEGSILTKYQCISDDIESTPIPTNGIRNQLEAFKFSTHHNDTFLNKRLLLCLHSYADFLPSYCYQ